MEGIFDFGPDGFATVVSAPDWSHNMLNELQGAFNTAADKLRDPGSSEASVMLDLVTTLEEQSRVIHEQSEAISKLVDAISQIQTAPPRSTLIEKLEATATLASGPVTITWFVEHAIEIFRALGA